MPLFQMSVKHNRTRPEARVRLELAVREARTKFGPLVQRVEWSADREAVTMSGVGFAVTMRVDDTDVHVEGDSPVLGKLLGGPVTAGLKAALTKAFPKPLT